jgi:anti-sigma factor RsiW
MDCKTALEYLLEHAEGKSTPASEHVGSCASCTKEVESLRATMAMLDEWTAPDPSPYFDQRLQARLREEKQKAPVGIFAWLRRPALAVGFAALLVAGVALIRTTPMGRSGAQMAAVRSASAVADLQSLDKNEDLYANFDLLDDLPNHDGQQQQVEQ